MENITDVELKAFDGWAKKMPGIKIETHIDLIRQSLKEKAYHEAGHAVTNAFFEGDVSHFKEVSIIPNQDRMGQFARERVLAFDSILKNYPSGLIWVKGKMRIIHFLGGRVAESIVSDSVEPLEEAVDESAWAFTDCSSEKEWRDGTDEGIALTTAEMIARRGWPPLRILFMMERWAHEFFEIPPVWGVVKSLAQKLISFGEITDINEYGNIIEPILFQWPAYPKWRSRFDPKVKTIKI